MNGYSGNNADESGAVVITGSDIFTDSYDVVVTLPSGKKEILAEGVSFILGNDLLREYAGKANVSLIPSRLN